MVPDDTTDDFEGEEPHGDADNPEGDSAGAVAEPEEEVARTAAEEGQAGGADTDGSGRRRRGVILGLAVALGVAGVSVLSVFIYSLFDDDPGGDWFAHEAASTSVYYPEERGYQGDERGKGPHGGVYDRAGDKDPSRDRAAGHADASPGTGDSVGDGGAGPGDDPAATDGLADCVELKSLGDRTLLLCDRGKRDGREFDLPPEGRGKWLGPDVLGDGWPRGWGPWSSGPGPGPRGPGRWPPGGGPFGQRPFGDGFPHEYFLERAPMGCPGLAPWGTMPDGGAAFGLEWSTPPGDYCVQGEFDGYAFEECYGFSGEFPPEGWRKGLEGGPPGSGYLRDDFAEGYGGPPWSTDGKGVDDGYAWEFGGSMPPELFDAWLGELLGSILEGLFEGFGDRTGGPEGDVDPEALDKLIPLELFEELFGSILGELQPDVFDAEGLDGAIAPELTEGMFEDMLGSILGNLFDYLDLDGLSFGIDPEGFEDLIPGELNEGFFDDLLGALLEGVDLGDLTSEAPDVPLGDEPGAG